MRFTADVRDLLAAINRARAVVPANPSILAYSGVQVVANADDTVVIYGSDGETTVAAAVTAQVTEPGRALLPPKPVSTFLSTVDPAVQADVASDPVGDVTITPEQYSPYRFRPVAATFPDSAGGDRDVTACDLSLLPAAVSAVKAAFSKDYGIQLAAEPGRIAVNATDSYRIHRAVIPTGGFGPFTGVFDVHALNRAVQIHPSGVAVGGKADVRFHADHATVTTRLLSSDFPDIEPILTAKPPATVEISVADARDCLARLDAICGSDPIQLAIDDRSVILKAESADIGAGAESVPVVGAPAPAPFSCLLTLSYLDEALAAHRSGTVTLGWWEPLRPLFLSSVGDLEITTVVMPVRG